MATLNPQAVDLNHIIRRQNLAIYYLLSKKGKAIYFPAKGILAQGAAAKGKEINATIGTAYEDDGSPMVLPALSGLLKARAGSMREQGTLYLLLPRTDLPEPPRAERAAERMRAGSEAPSGCARRGEGRSPSLANVR